LDDEIDKELQETIERLEKDKKKKEKK